MNLNSLSINLKRTGASLLIGILLLPCTAAAEEAVPSPQEQLNKHAIKSQVKILRDEKHDQMPYLDQGFIRKTISPQKVKDRLIFSAGSQKVLNDLVMRALAVHTPVRAARERISLAKRRILVALRELFPEVNLELQHRAGTLSTDPFNSRNFRFSFRQPVFRGGMLWNALLQEQASLEASQKEYEKVVSDLIRDVSVSYFEYQRAWLVKKEQEDEIEKVSRFVDISKQKLKQEIISEIEHLNAASLHGQMEYDYQTSQQEYELAKLDLQKFLDLNPKDNLDIASLYNAEEMLAKGKSYMPDENSDSNTAAAQTPSGDFQKAINIPNLTSLVDMAYEHRPELQVEAAKLQSARLEERVRWGDLMPHVDVVLEFGKLGEAFDVVTRDPGLRKEFRFMMEFTWNAAGNRINYTFENDERAPSVSQFQAGAGTQTTRNTVSFGLLDGLQSFADVKEAEIARLDQVIELENAEKEVVHDVKQAYFDFQKALIQVEASMKRTDYRRRLAQLAEHRLSQNEIQISEYVQAESDYMRELMDFHKALKDYFTAKADLNHALGMREFLPIEAKYGK